MKVLVVDDENLARDRLSRMLADIPDAQCIGEARNGNEAVQRAAELQPDIVLLDIRMPGMDGLEAARHLTALDEPPAVIFCTAYEEHAIEAFELQAVGYLLKPVRKPNLIAALEKAGRLNRAQLLALAGEETQRRSHIAARTTRGIELIPVDDVRFFQADQKYVTVRHGGGETIIDESLRELESEFGERFVRIHRNALAAARYIEGLKKLPEGGFQLKLRDVEQGLDISRRHVAEVRRFVKDL